MAQIIEKTVVKRTPNAVVRESTAVDSPSQTIMYLVYFVFGVAEILLLFRLLLRLTGANPSTGFVSFIYGMTQLLILPFRGIFPTATTEGAMTTAVFEPATIVAMLVYAAVAWGIMQLIAILSRQTAE